MADVEFRIESNAGVIQLASTPGDWSSPFRLMAGTDGLGLPPEIPRITDSPAGGGVLRSSKVGVRQAVLVVDVHGQDRADTAANLRRLAQVIKTSNRPALVAALPQQGTYRMPFVRTDGGGNGYDGGGDDIVTWTIGIQCPNPYWVADDPVQVAVRQQDITPVGLLPDLAELPVMASDAVGELNVTNPGEVEALMAWRIEGPGGAVTVQLGGRGFTIPDGLAAGEVITIEKGVTGWSVTDQAGANAYPRLGPAPKFPSVPVGRTKGVASLQSAGEGSGIYGFFYPLREVVH